MTIVSEAHVHKAGRLAAHLTRTPHGVEFRYDPAYLDSEASAIASTLPLTQDVSTTPAGAVPPFFAGLLPEGRRLSALRQTVKTSLDDELSLLAAIGADTIGDVTVTAETASGATGESARRETLLEVGTSFAKTSFADLLAEIGVSTKPSFAGVQDKVSAAMISVPLKRKHERYILKLNPPENPHLVQNEAYFIGLARSCRLNTVSARVVHDGEGTPGLLVTRFDRAQHEGQPRPLAVEDACQLLGRWPADKYAVTMEEVAASVMSITAAPVLAARDLVRQVVFAWLTGNGDLHAKNLSVVASPDDEFRMAPAYDLPSTLFYGDDTMALTIGGRDTLTHARLLEFGAELGLSKAATHQAIQPLWVGTAMLSERLTASSLPFERRLIAKVSRQLTTRHRTLSA